MKRVMMIGAILAALVFGTTASSQAYVYVRPGPRFGPRVFVPPYGPRAFVGPGFYGPRYFGPGYYGRAYYGYRGWGPGMYGPGLYGPRIGVGIY
jgi:hypothetical protein